jgi:GTP-binding protein HflX
MQIFIAEKSIKILIIGIITPKNALINIDSYYNEFKSLVESCNIVPDAQYFVKLRTLSPSTFISKGKLEEIKQICIEKNITEIILSESITPNQSKELSKFLGVTIYDRTDLILEIFRKRASSAEAKLQIEIAYLENKKTKIAGQGITLSQQKFRIGTIGPGETQKEINLRHINHLMTKLKRDIKQLHNVKATQRKQRQKNAILKIALVGYTNAGKSTLFNILTKSNVLAEDKLFATLDTATSELFIGSKKAALISDTVGFIQNLPHQLIEAFNATLKELEYADLILHIIDISNDDFRQQIQTVENVLKELDLENKKQLYVFNKIDLINEFKIEIIKNEFLEKEKLFIESKNKEGVLDLIEYIKKETEIINLLN